MGKPEHGFGFITAVTKHNIVEKSFMSLRTAFFILILMCIRYYGFGSIIIKEAHAYLDNGASLIKWTTATEMNNKKFIIERSADCIHFYCVGSVQGGFNSTTEKQYDFRDDQPLKGVSYYRIVSVDVQENKSDSDILTLDNRNDFCSNAVFPCPFKDEIKVKLNIENLPENSRLVIYGNSGRELYNCQIEPEIKLDMSEFKKDTYYVVVEYNGKRLLQKKILKNED